MYDDLSQVPLSNISARPAPADLYLKRSFLKSPEFPLLTAFPPTFDGPKPLFFENFFMTQSNAVSHPNCQAHHSKPYQPFKCHFKCSYLLH